MPILPKGQKWLIDRAKALGYRSNPLGVCHGVSHMGIQAWHLNDMATLKNRFKRIYSIPTHQMAKKADLDMLAYFDGIELYQQPAYYYQKVFETNISQRKEDAQIVAKYVQPQKLLDQGGLTIAMDESISGIYNHHDIMLYLQTFQRALTTRHPPFQERVSFSLRNYSHHIGIGFDPITNTWCLIDANKLDKIDKPFQNLSELAKEIHTSFFDNTASSHVAFSSDIYTTGNHRNELLACINDWKRSDEWNKIHEFSAERAKHVDEKGNTWLTVAAKSGALDDVNKLLSINGIDINHQNTYGNTPLGIAAFCNQLAVVKKLLNTPGIQVNLSKNNGETALMLAAEMGYLEVVKELLKAQGCAVNQQAKNGATALMKAVQHGHVAAVKELLNIPGINMDLCLQDDNIAGSSLLHMAAMYGHLEIVKLLLDSHVNVNQARQDGCTPLHLAAINGHTAIVNALLQAGAKVNQGNNINTSALYVAAEHGQAEVAKLLLQVGADINQSRTTDNWNPLYIALAMGQFNVVKVLLQNVPPINENESYRDVIRKLVEVVNVSVNQIFFNFDAPLLSIAAKKGEFEVVNALLELGANVNQGTILGNTPLCLAAENGHVDIVNILLKFGANINQPNLNGITPLYMAAEHDHLDVVKTLLNAHANFNLANNHGHTPLHIAAISNHFDTVRILLQPPATFTIEQLIQPIRGDDKAPLLFIAAEYGQLDIVNALIAAGIPVDQTNINKATPLCIAAENGYLDVVKALLAANANVNQENINNVTSLWIAANLGYVDIVNALIDKGANVNKANAAGVTPLWTAASNNRIDVVQALIKAHADVSIANKNGTTLLHFAAGEGHIDLVRELLKSDQININKKNLNLTNATALHFAAVKGHHEIVAMLIANGALVNTIRKSGETPLHDAVTKGHVKVVEILLKGGADINVKAGDPAMTPLQIAQQKGNTDIAELLIKQQELQMSTHGVKTQRNDTDQPVDDDEATSTAKKRKDENAKAMQPTQPMVVDTTSTATNTENDSLMKHDETHAYPSWSSASTLNQPPSLPFTYGPQEQGFFSHPNQLQQKNAPTNVVPENKSGPKKPNSSPTSSKSG